MKLADYPEISRLPTSLADETGKEISRVVLLQNLFLEMKNYTCVCEPVNPLEEWRENLVTLGKSIRVRSGDEVFEGLPNRWPTMAA